MATNEQVIAWLTANPTATDAEITAAANASGVSAAQLAAVTGLPVAAVESRMSAAAPAAQTSAPVTAAPANQGLAENATMAGGLLDQYKAYLKPAEYEQLIAPLAFTANENFGGKVQDYQVQLITSLDTSKIGLPKQLEFTPVTMQTVSGQEGETYQIPVGGELKTAGVQELRSDNGEGGFGQIIGYKSTTPTMINGVPVFTNYDASGKVTGYEGDNRVTTWTDGNNRLIGNWDASGKAAPISSASETGMFNTGFHWNDLRDNLEAAAVIAGNYILPGSSLVSGQLVTKGAKENLATDAGQLANFAAGAAGGLEGNMANYGKVGEAVGLTGAPTEAGAVPSGAESVPSATPSVTAPSGSTSLLDYSMPTANGGLGLQGTAALDGTLASGLAAPAGGSLGGGLGLTAGAAGNLGYMGGAQGLTTGAAGGGTLSAGGVNTGLFTPDNLYNSTGGLTSVGPKTNVGTTLTPAQVIKAIPLVTTVNALVGDPLGIQPKQPETIATPTGFGIVPIPEGWKSPTYSQGAQTPIDLSKIFSNQNLLTGTQWEGLPNQQNLTFNDIFAAGKQMTPMGTPVNINNIVSAILGQTATSQKSA
jgi:hypothetical protein